MNLLKRNNYCVGMFGVFGKIIIVSVYLNVNKTCSEKVHERTHIRYGYIRLINVSVRWRKLIIVHSSSTTGLEA